MARGRVLADELLVIGVPATVDHYKFTMILRQATTNHPLIIMSENVPPDGLQGFAAGCLLLTTSPVDLCLNVGDFKGCHFKSVTEHNSAE